MKSIQLTERLVIKFQNLVNSKELSMRARLKDNCFVRDRKLSARNIFLLITGGIRTSLQLAIDDFFEKVLPTKDPSSKQALSKARTNFNPDVIKELFQGTVTCYNECTDTQLWKEKYRVYAMDGSDISLDNAADLKDYFGCSGSKKDATTAMLSTCYDVLNNYILDASFDPYITGEREAARAHIDTIMQMPISKGVHSLFLMDRGYPSAELMAEMIDKSQFFLMRVRRKFNLEFDAVEKDEYVCLTVNGKTYVVRVIKVTLSTGEIETLVTNLTPDELSYEESGDLYFYRWGIETKYDSIKNKFQLCNFSGRRKITAMQDFWATMYLCNLASSVAFQSNAVILNKTVDKSNKHEQTTNEARLLYKLRKKFYTCLLETNEDERNRLFYELISDISKYPQQIKIGRTTKRKAPRKMKFNDRRKFEH